MISPEPLQSLIGRFLPADHPAYSDLLDRAKRIDHQRRELAYMEENLYTSLINDLLDSRISS